MQDSTQPIQDLLWAVNSQPLLDKTPTVDQIDLSAIDADHFWQFINERPGGHKVGRYFERLIHYWLEHIRKVQIVHQAKQIRVGKRTIGEIDFIFRDHSDQLVHWETAIKFYLYDPQAKSHTSHFIGPNAADNFQKKTAKMFSSQLPLSEEHFPEVQVRQAFVKGRIFYHPDQPKPTSLPDHLGADHLKGRWIRAAELQWFDQFSGSVFRFQQKPLWLTASPIDVSDEQPLSALALIEQLKLHLADRGYPVLVSQHCESSDPEWIFVVPDHWPNNEK